MTVDLIAQWFSDHHTAVIRCALLIGLGIPGLRILVAFFTRLIRLKWGEQTVMLTNRIILYGGYSLIAVTLLRECGFQIGPLLGAAGVAGVAVGFASQTSLSNLISGIFLVLEKPCQINDVLDVGGTVGMVHSIDLLSVKLRTFDNKFVRIPNETLVKASFTNITRFPIRRLDIEIGVAYKEDVDHVTEVLMEIADQNPLCLDEPVPIVIFMGFGDSSLDFKLGVWFEKADVLKLRNSIMRDIKKRFDELGIEIPFPHRTIYVGSQTQPFPLSIQKEPIAKPPPIVEAECESQPGPLQ